MLSFVEIASCMLVLTASFVVVELLSVGRVDGGGNILCTHALLEKDLVPEDLGFRRISIQDDSHPDSDVYDDEDSSAERGFQGEEEDGDDRSNLEWRKIKRYIKKQLKVPRRYLKKIVRTLGVAGTLRSANQPDRGDGVVSLMSHSETDELNSVIGRTNSRFETKRLLLVDEPDSVEYFAIIAAPGSRMFQ